MTWALPAWVWICTSGPTASMRSPSIRIPTLVWACCERASTSRPALMRICCGACLGSGAAVARIAIPSGRARNARRDMEFSFMKAEGGLNGPKILHLRGMATLAPPQRKVSADEAREVAEAAREQEWASPSFVRDLFLGKLRMDLIHPYPEQDADEIARAKPFLDKLERFLREEVDSDKIDREGEIPEPVIEGLRKLGAFGIKIPREYGGLGLSQLSYMKAIELVSSVDGSLTRLLSAHQPLRVPPPLKMF